MICDGGGFVKSDISIDTILCFGRVVNMRIIICIMLLVLLAGCDLFKLRDADPPADPAPWSYDYTFAGSAVSNLRFCYIDARNYVKYAGLFTSDYRFHFAVQDINDYNISQIWDRGNERDMLNNLHNWMGTGTIELTLHSIINQPDEINATDAVFYRTYVLKTERSTVEQEYQGKLELHLRLQDGAWKIKHWYDFRSGVYPTWGKLKYDFAI
ncbi:MAG: nuclear transport factor 2 family protein [Candidatus Cloacimonetes bacterium]|nr:nuclear transport factor 2 family protein [Candidatus Cloacimonadota bacterium]